MRNLFDNTTLPNGFTLRPATEGDRSAYADLTLETLGVYARDVFGLSDEAVISGSRAEFAPVNSWVVEDGSAVVAVVVVERRSTEVWLDHMVVTERCQRRGIGTVLVRAVQLWSETQNLPVTLSVVDGNPARELYARLGFVVDRIVPPRTFFRWDAEHRQGAPSGV